MDKPRPVIHGLYKTAEYKTLKGMIERCMNPDNPRFSYYGGRGITVCERWRESVEAFVSDMGLRPSALHSIERIDNDAGYTPENCRWATKKEQCRNRRTSVFHVAHGLSLTLPEWAERLGFPEVTLRKRLRAGWPADRVFSSTNFQHVAKAEKFQRGPDSRR